MQNKDSQNFSDDRQELHQLVEDYRSLGERLDRFLKNEPQKVRGAAAPNRRELFKLSAAAVAGLGASSLFPATPAMASGTGAGTVYLWPSPIRMYDSRDPSTGWGRQPPITDWMYYLALPMGAVYGYLGTVTAVNWTGAGWLVVHNYGASLAGVTLNYGGFSGWAISSFFACTANWDANVNKNRIYVYNGQASTDVIIDMVGYVYS